MKNSYTNRFKILAGAGLLLILPACPFLNNDPEVDSSLTIHAGTDFTAGTQKLIFRGVNARVKGLFDVEFDDGREKLEPIPEFGEEDCKFLAEQMGFNLLRLPVNWSGIEPQKGQYEQEYLDHITQTMDACWRHGIYTLVDLHQDAYSKHIGEDGAPLWAIVPEPTELLEGPLTDLTKRRASDQVYNAFDSFYSNVEGLQDAYAEMASVLAQQIADHPGVIGLEIQNEPYILTDVDRIHQFQAKIALAIREVAPNLPVAIEPNSQRNLIDKVLETLPNYNLSNLIYAPHIYTGVFQNDWKIGEDRRIEDSILEAQNEALLVGGALFIGEFGNDHRTDAGREWLSTTLEIFDRQQVSWAMWVYEEWSQDSWGLYDGNHDLEQRIGLREDAVELYARPYPMSIDGSLRSFEYDTQSKVLEVFLSPTTAETDSEEVPVHTLAIPAATYPGGVRVFCGEFAQASTPTTGRLEIACAEEQIRVVGIQ